MTHAQQVAPSRSTQELARRVTKRLNRDQLMLRRTTGVVLPTGSPRPAGLHVLGLAALTAIWSAMNAQDALAAGILADLKAQADAKSTIPPAFLGTLRDDVTDHSLRSAAISKELKFQMSKLEFVFGIFSRGAAMAMIAESTFVYACNFDQIRKTIEVINNQQPVDEDGKLNPSPAVAAINRVLQHSRTVQVSVNWDMAVRSLLGMYFTVGENVTYLDKASEIDFPAAVEEKNEMALWGPGELFTRGDADKVLAELNVLGRSANRRSTRRELVRSRARHLSGRGQVGRCFFLEQGQPHAAASGNQDWAGQGGYLNGGLGYAEDAQPYCHPHEAYGVYGPGSCQDRDAGNSSYGEESGTSLQLYPGAGADQDCYSWVSEAPAEMVAMSVEGTSGTCWNQASKATRRPLNLDFCFCYMCGTYETGYIKYNLCDSWSGPGATRLGSWKWGCAGTARNFSRPILDTTKPGSSA